jgi:hypothetical protein
VVCGLPSGTNEFSVLPARFRPDTAIDWSNIVANYMSYPEGKKVFLTSMITYFSEAI